jgi:hypothetical protein
MNQKKPNKRKFDNFIRYSGLGIEMMAIISAGTFAGYKIDQWMNNTFKGFTFGLMVVSVVLAIIYGLKNLLKNK